MIVAGTRRRRARAPAMESETAGSCSANGNPAGSKGTRGIRTTWRAMEPTVRKLAHVGGDP
jgi:hypothetical protein